MGRISWILIPGLVWASGCVGSGGDGMPEVPNDDVEGKSDSLTVRQACMNACDAQANSGCPRPLAIDDCMDFCDDETFYFGCNDEWAAFQQCLSESPHTCDADGYPEIKNACASEGSSFFSCFEEAESKPTACESSDDCRPGQACNTETKTCVECTSDDQCGAFAPACDTETNTCVECNTNDHCEYSSWPACDSELHKCVECMGDGDCPYGSCDLETSTCVECKTDDHCMFGFAPACDVETSTCVECTADEHCAADFDGSCDMESMKCRECMTNEHCTRDTRPHCDAEAGSCVKCIPEQCDGVCDALGACVECVSNSDCGSTQECEYDRCIDRCLEDTDCPESSCTGGLCAVPIGTPCAERSSLCYPGGSCIDVSANLESVEPYCTDICFGTDECPDGYECQDVECRKL